MLYLLIIIRDCRWLKSKCKALQNFHICSPCKNALGIVTVFFLISVLLQFQCKLSISHARKLPFPPPNARIHCIKRDCLEKALALSRARDFDLSGFRSQLLALSVVLRNSRLPAEWAPNQQSANCSQWCRNPAKVAPFLHVHS